MYRLHGSILAYGGEDARSTADSVITALSPAAWYRNATGVTEAGGFASQWDDYSGNTRHLVQATGTNQPAYANGIFTFDGLDNYMVASTWLQTQPVSLYIALNQVGWTNADNIIDGTTSLTMLLQQKNGGASPVVAQYAGGYGGETTSLLVGTFGILCAVFNGASSLVRVNNNADSTGNAGAGAGGGVTLGASASLSFPANFQAKEIVLFPAAHSDAQRTSVITALNNALTVF